MHNFSKPILTTNHLESWDPIRLDEVIDCLRVCKVPASLVAGIVNIQDRLRKLEKLFMPKEHIISSQQVKLIDPLYEDGPPVSNFVSSRQPSAEESQAQPWVRAPRPSLRASTTIELTFITQELLRSIVTAVRTKQLAQLKAPLQLQQALPETWPTPHDTWGVKIITRHADLVSQIMALLP